MLRRDGYMVNNENRKRSIQDDNQLWLKVVYACMKSVPPPIKGGKDGNTIFDISVLAFSQNGMQPCFFTTPMFAGHYDTSSMIFWKNVKKTYNLLQMK